MKKFKTRKKFNKIKIIIAITLFLILFIIISLCKLNSSYNNLTNTLLKEFNMHENTNSLSFLTSRLDYLFNSYYFKKNDVIYQEDKKIIYLYNTHNQEKYNDNTSIFDATKLLKNNLNRLGINVIQEERKTSDYLHTGLSYYDISRTFIKDIMNQDQNISYYIDIHRDSVTNPSIIINNKSYAKIMFVLGLENKNYEKNKAIMVKMNNFLNQNYPGISKGIYEKKGSGVDGVYNQDLEDNILLIEIGGIKNNIEEVNNSTEIIALMLYDMLGD